MKVYLLLKLEDWSFWDILGVFKDREKAEKEMEKLQKKNIIDGWRCKHTYKVEGWDLKC